MPAPPKRVVYKSGMPKTIQVRINTIGIFQFLFNLGKLIAKIPATNKGTKSLGAKAVYIVSVKNIPESIAQRIFPSSIFIKNQVPRSTKKLAIIAS